MINRIIVCVLAAACLFSGCSALKTNESAPKDTASVTAPQNEGEIITVERPDENPAENRTESDADVVLFSPEDFFSSRDLEGTYDEASAVPIVLSGDSASCSSGAVQINGSTVTITKEGTYLLSGSLLDGSVIVETTKEEKVQLVLNGVSMTSSVSAPIYVRQADKVFVTLADGTENHLENGGSFEAIDDNAIDAVIFSKDDLTLNGSGALTVMSPAGHGIVSKDELTVTGGTYRLVTASHGLVGKDSVAICSASVDMDTGKDGIHAENKDNAALGSLYIESGTFTGSTAGDGISASFMMQIDGGTFDLTTGGGSENAEPKTQEQFGGGPGGMPGRPGGGMPGKPRTMTQETTAEDTSQEDVSAKGIKSAGDLVIRGGIFTIDAADDAVHSNADLLILDGVFDVQTGDDGFHADAAAVIRGGEIDISESYEGVEGLSVEIHGGNLKITASDDGINAAGGTDQSGFGGMRGGDMFASDPNSFVNIFGGNIQIQASGDGIDSNGALEISGGYTVVSGPTYGDTAVLDYGERSTGSIQGGTFIGTGALQMAQSFSAAEQGVIALNVDSQAAGSTISLSDENGSVLLTYTPPLDYSIAILSCPEMISGKDYTVTIGSVSGTFTAK